MKKLIAIAVSGGIDSLVAAFRLKQQGHELIGIHFVTGYENDPCFKPYEAGPENENKTAGSVATESVTQKVKHIENQLGIPIAILDCREPFKSKVVDYFTQTYQTGQTPNPCLMCNRSIKFGTLLDFAGRLGASGLATGHYAKALKSKEGRWHLLKGRDRGKDQSYFLALLSQKQLASAYFPLGAMTKSEVIRLAAEEGLTPFVKAESQDVCFIKAKNYADFLALQPGFRSEPGFIEDVSGNIIGEHRGLHHFTIGQRRGINCPAAEPYYVVRIDRDRNRLVVGAKHDLQTEECRVVGINWICAPPDLPVDVHTRVRYRHQAVASTLMPSSNGTAVIRFATPQSAVTPGQGAVFYLGDEVLGGGWIAEN